MQEQHAKGLKDLLRASGRKSEKGDDHPRPIQTEERGSTPSASVGSSSTAKEKTEPEKSEAIPEGEYSVLDDPDIVVLSAETEKRDLDAQLAEERNSV